MIFPGRLRANMSAASKSTKILFVAALFFSASLYAKPFRNVLDVPRLAKDSFREGRFSLFPVPVFETDPAAGQRYGVMPTLLLLDENKDLYGIWVTAGTYNPNVVKFGLFSGLFLYPSEDESLTFFYETAQNYISDYYLRYSNENWLEEKFAFETSLEYIVDPFERFYGFGPKTKETDATNFVSQLWWWQGTAGYEFFPDITFRLEETWRKMTLKPRALNKINDTATLFAADTNVASQNQWRHRFGLVWDTRDSNDFPTSGHFVEPHFLLSHKSFGDEHFFYGYGVKAKTLFTKWKYFTTVFAFKMDQVIGDTIPFYEQPRLGGDFELRAFVFRRFVGKGSLLLDIEERIKVKSWHFMDVDFDLSLDPFFSVGQVFNQWGDVAFNNLKPVGGVGIRAKVPPSVLGRIDIGVGPEGVEVFTGLDYPF